MRPLMKSTLTLLLFITSAAFAQEPALDLRPTLTLAIVQKITKACEIRQLKNKGAPVSIAIFDDGGNLSLFHRMTGASLGSITVAMEKGKSAANFPFSTRDWGEYIKKEKGVSGVELLPNITTIPGGVPILTSDGIHLGGIGVSGSSSDDDENCAITGLNAVKNSLAVGKFER